MPFATIKQLIKRGWFSHESFRLLELGVAQFASIGNDKIRFEHVNQLESEEEYGRIGI